jgi:hypothetical protein
MSRRSDHLTGELFASIPQPAPTLPGSMDFRMPVSELVSEMLANAKREGIDRYEVAARVSRLADPHETSKAILDAYTSPSREESNLPLWKAPLLEIACDSRALAEWHANVLGGRILWGEEILDADLGSIERQIRELSETRKKLQQVQQQQRQARRR